MPSGSRSGAGHPRSGSSLSPRAPRPEPLSLTVAGLVSRPSFSPASSTPGRGARAGRWGANRRPAPQSAILARFRARSTLLGPTGCRQDGDFGRGASPPAALKTPSATERARVFRATTAASGLGLDPAFTRIFGSPPATSRHAIDAAADRARAAGLRPPGRRGRKGAIQTCLELPSARPLDAGRIRSPAGVSRRRAPHRRRCHDPLSSDARHGAPARAGRCHCADRRAVQRTCADHRESVVASHHPISCRSASGHYRRCAATEARVSRRGVADSGDRGVPAAEYGARRRDARPAIVVEVVRTSPGI